MAAQATTDNFLVSLFGGNFHHPLFKRPKNQNTSGTFHEHAFQMYLSPKESEDPLNIKLFDQLWYHCTTHCGIYGDEYDPNIPIALLKIPSNAVKQAFEPHLYNETLRVQSEIGFPLQYELYFMIHTKIQPQVCQHFTCNAVNEINIILHTWTFPDLLFTPEAETQTSVFMGVFSPTNVSPAHQTVLSITKSNLHIKETYKELNGGMPFNKMERRIVGIRFSPLNAQLALDEGKLHSFYCASALDNRCIISYHVIPDTQVLILMCHLTLKEQSDALEGAVNGSNSLGELLHKISALGSDFQQQAVIPLASMINALFV